jgi:RimJ/RimL family protein N-acetyltransferase
VRDLRRLEEFDASTTIGYWLDEAHHGHGLMTRAARALDPEAPLGFRQVRD